MFELSHKLLRKCTPAAFKKIILSWMSMLQCIPLRASKLLTYLSFNCLARRERTKVSEKHARFIQPFTPGPEQKKKLFALKWVVFKDEWIEERYFDRRKNTKSARELLETLHDGRYRVFVWFLRLYFVDCGDDLSNAWQQNFSISKSVYKSFYITPVVTDKERNGLSCSKVTVGELFREEWPQYRFIALQKEAMTKMLFFEKNSEAEYFWHGSQECFHV